MLPKMRTTPLCLFLLSLSLAMLGGCEKRGENQVIQGTGNEITLEMIEVEEAELETEK